MNTVAGLLDELVERELENEPVRATQLGAVGYDARMPDLSATAYDERERWERDLLARFEAVSPDGLEFDDGIDRELAISELRGRVILHEWADWRRSPDTYLGQCLYGVFLMFLHRLRPDAELVPDAVTRLRAVGEVLARARENLDPAVAVEPLVRRALGMCGAGAVYFRSFLPAEVDDGPLRAELADGGAAAADAFDSFAEFLSDLADQASGDFALGEATYSRLLREREALSYDLGSLHQLGRKAHDELVVEMSERARAIAGTGDVRAVMTEAQADHPATPEEMRVLYGDWTQRARAFLAERDLVSFPAGEECRVVPSPLFQRPMLAVASYMRPPAFTASRVGHFFVPFPPDDSSDDDVQQRLAQNNRSAIPPVAVHEAYPGHHWHLAMAAGNPRRVRKMFGTPYFSEGWALYTEQMMREEGFFGDPLIELVQLDQRLFRACRIIVDTALHAGDMTVAEAIAFMHDRAGCTDPVAKAEVLRYCAWPTQAPAYLTGSLELERIRDDYFAQQKGDLKTFHDTLAYSGVLPLGLAERAVMEG